ncbi:MAG: twin-arginine translocation signal domain-containing protein [Bacteroidota bacterium]
MNRRNFIKTAAATAGAISMPYILPSGRLFAQTTARRANHVVLVLFAGGVRQQETVDMRYLDGSQNEAIPGNIMYNLLDGAPPIDKIVYGTTGNRPGEIPIPAVLSNPLQRQGTLFREMRASQAGHYSGLNVAVQGNTKVTQGLRQKPINPTIFEYLRRHAGFMATDTWFIGNGIGNSVPLLNYSEHPDYGANYGANFFAPRFTFGDLGFKHLANAKNYHPEYELDPMYKMKAFLDNSFRQVSEGTTGIGNTMEEKLFIKSFMEEMFTKTQSGTVTSPAVMDTNDLVTLSYTCEVLKWFKPALTVVNFNDMDACHASFTGYLRNLHRLDHGVGFLWDFIQSQIPEMSNDTIMILLPECGRNLEPNPIRDENNWFGYDHSDFNTQRIFGMMAGPTVPQDLVVGDENNPVGESADVVPTIADIFGIKQTVANQGLLSATAMSLFDRI